MQYDLDYFREKFNQSYTIDSLTGCWLWHRRLTRNGYGEISHGKLRTNALAHRLSYQLHKGPIPEGLDLDHLCRVRHCVNPSHLEPVSRRVNTLRGINPPAKNAMKTHCSKGHPFDLFNTLYRYNGRRYCRTCECPSGNHSPRKLTPEKVTQIRELYATGNYTHVQLGGMFDVSDATISLVISRKHWAKVP